ncbi:hypothetical protein N7470_007166 [Penicillium chermesinum]|nr:hypothetical protein N7470_007166 [Penicillium chermesinum]
MILRLGYLICLSFSMEISLNDSSLTSLIRFLSMQYHQIIIFFHRPWVSKSYIQPRSPRQGPGYHHARRISGSSASHIRETLYLRRMNNQVVAIIFSAALMLLFVTVSSSPLMPSKPGETSQPHPRNAEMVAYLNLCFRALDELGQSFENAKRTRDYLVTLQRRWQAHMRRSGPVKRQLSSANLRSNPPPRGPSSSQPGAKRTQSDPSRKKSRLSAARTHTQVDVNQKVIPSAINDAPALPAYPPSEPLSSQQNAPVYAQQNLPTIPQPGNFDWSPTTGLDVTPAAHSIGLSNPMNPVFPQFPDEPGMLPDLGDMEGWWGSSPNGSPGLGGSSL